MLPAGDQKEQQAVRDEVAKSQQLAQALHDDTQCECSQCSLVCVWLNLLLFLLYVVPFCFWFSFAIFLFCRRTQVPGGCVTEEIPSATYVFVLFAVCAALLLFFSLLRLLLFVRWSWGQHRLFVWYPIVLCCVVLLKCCFWPCVAHTKLCEFASLCRLFARLLLCV